MKSILTSLLFLIYSYSYCQTFSKIYDFGENAVNNYFNGFDLKNKDIYIISSNFCRREEGNFIYKCTTITKFDNYGNIVKQIKNDTLDAFDQTSLRFFQEKIFVSGIKSTPGNWFGRNTEIYLYDQDLNLENQISLIGRDDGVINNVGLWPIDSFLYIIGVFNTPNPSSAQIFKLDKYFYTVWELNYQSNNINLGCNDISKTHDGNLAFRFALQPRPGINDDLSGFTIVKINQDGDTLKTYYYEDDSNEPNSLLVAKDGSFYFNSDADPLNFNNLFTGRLNKLNPEMDSILWSMILPNDPFIDGRIYSVEDIIESKNGDIVACGKVHDNSDSKVIGGDVSSTRNGFIIRVTPYGQVLWLKVYKHPQNIIDQTEYGQHRHSILRKIFEKENGDFVAAGEVFYTQYQRNQINPNENEISHLWLMTTDSLGCVDGYPCDEIVRFYNTSNPKLVTPEVYWTESDLDITNGNISNTRYKFSVDTIILGTNRYHELLYSQEKSGSTFENTNRFFREENNRIYEFQSNEDILMYNFNLNKNDTFLVHNLQVQNPYPIITNQILDSITLLNDERRKVLEMNCKGIEPELSTWIEGIGSTKGFLSVFNSCAFDVNTSLQCFYRNDTLLYMNPESSNCWTVAAKDISLSSLIIVPNPTHGIFEIIGDIEFDNLTLFNSIGQKVFKTSYTKSLNISNLPTGQYFIEISHKGYVLARQKVIKIE
jgi:hypothetical protein